MSGKNRRAIENAVSRQTEWLHEKNRDLMDMLFEAYEHNDDLAADVAMMAWEAQIPPCFASHVMLDRWTDIEFDHRLFEELREDGTI